ITASIGIASADIVSQKLFEIAYAQLELALNRGGDQAVVYQDGVISYYGARTTTIENRSPVHVRVKTEQFVDIVNEAARVLIMTHDNSDADAFGSSLAVYKIVLALNKPVKIVFDPEKIDPTIKNVYEEIKTEHVNVLDYFIHPKDAMFWMTGETLLVITDVQYENLLLDEKLYKQAKKLAIIDHHRRNNFAITNYDYLYTQTSASSTVELVVEMLEFVDAEVEISNIEATWMLMGVIVDTNNLMYRVSYRTFNTLAILQKFGAEMPKVQRYLRENLQEYVERVAALNKLEIIDGKYGIAIAGDNIYPRSGIAKIADTIISVNNIKAAFCIGKIDENEIAISARSLDEMNVQVIMEQLGGGGHYNNAAAQFKNTTIELVKEALIEKLKRIDEGGQQTMKIILTKDVKGKGKEGDIIDIPAGHANFLIRSEQAIMATVDNIKQLEKRNAQEKEEQERLLAEMKALKVIIDKTPVTVAVRVGKEGKLFGSVSGKHIIDEYKLQNGISLDKRKMIYDKDIDQLGTFKIPIQLHKEVTAEITLYVVEKK
ncbi:MAG TPA: 50S ribosomal protein L9, partial [Bacilli bacterium]|nr:50S ribosomal protein L9 [Bacilli bacterium]